MVQRYMAGYRDFDGYRSLSMLEKIDGGYVRYADYQELEAENARLRQQRDAANAQLDFILENKTEHCKHQFVYSALGWEYGFRYGYVCRFCGEHQK